MTESADKKKKRKRDSKATLHNCSSATVRVFFWLFFISSAAFAMPFCKLCAGWSPLTLPLSLLVYHTSTLLSNLNVQTYSLFLAMEGGGCLRLCSNTVLYKCSSSLLCIIQTDCKAVNASSTASKRVTVKKKKKREKICPSLCFFSTSFKFSCLVCRFVSEGHCSEWLRHFQLVSQLPTGHVHQNSRKEGWLHSGGHGRVGGLPEAEEFPGAGGPRHTACALPHCLRTCCRW